LDVEWDLSGLLSVWDKKLRHGGAGIGVAAGDEEAWCVSIIRKPTALAASAQGNQPWGNRGGKRRSISLQPGSWHSRECDEEERGEDYVSTERRHHP